MLSFASFLVCLTWTLWQPSAWPWTLGIVIANRIILLVAVPLPRSTLMGANIACLPEEAAQHGKAAITIDDSPDPNVTPRAPGTSDGYDLRAVAVLHNPEPDPVLAHNGLSLRGHGIIPIYCRSTQEWQDLLHRCGFEARSLPMHQGTPFCNILLIAKTIPIPA